MKRTKTPVGKRALIARINRRLRSAAEPKEAPEVLRAARGGRALQSLGDYYVVDTCRNFVVHRDVDVEEFAREVGALADWEELVED